MQLVSTRGAALAFGLPRYFTGKACVNGHVSERVACSGSCIECTRILGKKRYHSDVEASRTKQRAKRAASPEKFRAATSRWKRNNPDVNTFHSGMCHAAKLQRTPSWADEAKIESVYVAARLVSDITGKPWHVDHVIPLRGERVSGLHIYENLQLLRGTENSGKKNRYEVA